MFFSKLLYNYSNFCTLSEFVDYNLTFDSIPNFVLIDVDGVLQLSSIYFPIGFAFIDSFLEAPETFAVLIIEQNYELDPPKSHATVTILDATCKNLFVCT